MWQDIKNIYHLCVAFIANIWFEFPSRKLTVIGVTGTDGKTTTTSLIYHILNKSGLNASMVSSVGAIIGGKNYDVGFHVTTPSPFALQRFIKRAADLSFRQPHVADDARSAFTKNHKISRSLNEILSKSLDSKPTNDVTAFNSSASGLPRSYSDFLVLETTSHALDQFRVFGIKFDIGVLTNVTHEHLDYHKTYEDYVKTKAKLLKMAKVAVVNRDDESYRQISNFKFLISKLVTYGMTKKADVNPANFSFKTNLIGEFNKYNILAAATVCKALGLNDEQIRNAITSFKLPQGRADIVYSKDFKVMIDFAHTPNAFEQILSSLRSKVNGRIIHVFGSAGERDASKRPLMGKASSKFSDIIILTSEDPRTESVEKINSEIESGIKIPKIKIFKIPDRKKAIESAIATAKRGDFVLITGKSHEKSMNYGHGEIAWDEYIVVKDALRTI